MAASPSSTPDASRVARASPAAWPTPDRIVHGSAPAPSAVASISAERNTGRPKMSAWRWHSRSEAAAPPSAAPPAPWWRPLADAAKRAVLFFAFQRAKQPERIREVLPSLPAAERRVAHELLRRYPVAGLETVARLAAQSGVSGPTVVRLVGKLDFEGHATGSFAWYRTRERPPATAVVVMFVSVALPRRGAPPSAFM